MNVYDNPKYYETAFSFRDIPAEVNFLEKLFAHFSKIPVKTILELASGNSPHIDELCSRGYRYLGLEFSSEMIQFTEQKIAERNYSASIVQGDMKDFSLPKTVDCALVFLGSLYVKNDDELRSHLRSVATAVNRGGLYILESVVSFFPEDVHKQSWEMQAGETKVVTSYDPTWLNEKDGLMAGKITLDVIDDGKTIHLEHTEVKKIYSAIEFIRIAEAIGEWEHVGSYSDFDVDSEPKEKARNTLVLRRV